MCKNTEFSSSRSVNFLQCHAAITIACLTLEYLDVFHAFDGGASGTGQTVPGGFIEQKLR